jgi:SanA protein
MIEWCKRVFAIILLSGLLGVGLLLAVRAWINTQVRHQIYERIEDVPRRPVALVLGAAVWPDGRPTPILADRVATGADLLEADKAEVLLFSGDNRFDHYNEPQRMLEYAQSIGVAEEEVILDFAGRRTYDSCYRARAIFGVERVIVVTQRFHIARAVYLCEALGLDAVGVVADRRTYSRQRIVWETREYLALVLAWWDVNIRHPVPVLGDPLPIQVGAAGAEHTAED